MRKEPDFTPGKWDVACDSYGKVMHSKKACVYTVIRGPSGDQIFSVAARIPNWKDALVMAAAVDLYKVLKYMNHVDPDTGYCICPLNDGGRPDEHHSTSCSDAREAIRLAEDGNRPR